jgi:ABC-2 type transport system permease protein
MDIVYTLWLRQIRRYSRNKSRIIGTIGQPLLLMLSLGYGLGAVYAKAGQGSYIQFLVPGIIAQTILLSAIFWGIIILMDKRFGFLSELLVAPVKRHTILLGSALGGATITLAQGILVLAVSIGLGFRPYDWLMVVPAIIVMLIVSLALTSVGAGIASMVDDFQGFQAINNLIVMPLFFLSNALYPIDGLPQPLKLISTLNPISYIVDTLRALLIGQHHFSMTLNFTVIALTLVVSVVFAVRRFDRIQM